MCHALFIPAVLRKLPKQHHKEIAKLLKDSLADHRMLQDCADELDIRGFPQAANTFEQFIPGFELPDFSTGTMAKN